MKFSIEYKIYTLCGYQILSDVKNLPLRLPEMTKKTFFPLKVKIKKYFVLNCDLFYTKPNNNTPLPI